MISEARIATTDNITLSGVQTLQSVLLVAATDTVLVTGQTDGAANGPYTVQTGAWTRHTDHDIAAEFVKPWQIFIREGDYENWRFQFTNATGGLPPTLGTTILNFEPFEMAEVLRAGAGLEIVDGVVRAVNRFPVDTWYAGPPDVVRVDSEGFVTGITEEGNNVGYLAGFNLEYVSSSIIRVKAGHIWVETQDPDDTTRGAFLDTIQYGGNIPVSLSSLAANTLYYLYTAPVGDDRTTNIVYSATAPIIVHNWGDDLVKGPSGSQDMSSRYIGTFRTNASGLPMKFQMDRGTTKYPEVWYLEDTTASPFRVVSASAAQTETTVNLGASGSKLVPASCRMAIIRVTTNASAGVALGNSEDNVTGGSGNAGIKTLNISTDKEVFMPLDASQSFTFWNRAASGSCSIDLLGYADSR